MSSRGFTQQTALSRRVKDWEDAVQPQLLRLVKQHLGAALVPASLPAPPPVLQEARPPFDIHDYSDQVVAALSGVGRRRTFASIVAGLDNVEACKFLLASLQLVSAAAQGAGGPRPHLRGGRPHGTLRLGWGL